VSISLRDAGIEAVLLDIEGTTTPIAFVHDVLFPYARARSKAYLEATSSDPEIAQLVDELWREREAGGLEPKDAPRTIETVAAYVEWLIDRDRKSRPLKTLQGKIWEDGYATGALKGEVYPDVPPALARWTASGVAVGIFSSGSVLAQQLLFRHSTAGDLTPFLTWHFDTAVGAKGDAESYRRIAHRLGVSAPRVLFVSDVVAELDAARASGMSAALSVRPPAEVPRASSYTVVHAFDQIV
jgi:enolase-phosphatase E1